MRRGKRENERLKEEVPGPNHAIKQERWVGTGNEGSYVEIRLRLVGNEEWLHSLKEERLGQICKLEHYSCHVAK